MVASPQGLGHWPFFFFFFFNKAELIISILGEYKYSVQNSFFSLLSYIFVMLFLKLLFYIGA